MCISGTWKPASHSYCPRTVPFGFYFQNKLVCLGFLSLADEGVVVTSCLLEMDKGPSLLKRLSTNVAQKLTEWEQDKILMI